MLRCIIAASAALFIALVPVAYARSVDRDVGYVIKVGGVNDPRLTANERALLDAQAAGLRQSSHVLLTVIAHDGNDPVLVDYTRTMYHAFSTPGSSLRTIVLVIPINSWTAHAHLLADPGIPNLTARSIDHMTADGITPNIREPARLATGIAQSIQIIDDNISGVAQERQREAKSLVILVACIAGMVLLIVFLRWAFSLSIRRRPKGNTV